MVGCMLLLIYPFGASFSFLLALGLSCLRFHPDGLYIGTGTSDNQIIMWDVKSQSKVATFKGHTAGVGSISFSENG